MAGKPPKSPGISPMRIQNTSSESETKSISRLKKFKRRISASFKNLTIMKDPSANDSYPGSANKSYNASSKNGIPNSYLACRSLNTTPRSKSTQHLMVSCVNRSIDDAINQSPSLADVIVNVNQMPVQNQNLMSRHHSSAGDFLSIHPLSAATTNMTTGAGGSNNISTLGRGVYGVRSRPSRPKSEGNLSMQSMKSKRASSFGLNSPYGKAELYQKLEQLGKGSYATVFKGFSLLTNNMVALKEIKLETEEGTPFTAIREASLLKGLKHANIVTLHDIVHTKTSLTFVFEYLHIDLGQYLDKHKGGLNPHNVKLFLFQLLRGLAFCHDKQILHRDLKPQNLLISEKGELKLADFGLARAKSIPSRTFSDEVVTLWYRPPDLLLGSTHYSTSLDVWGVGCIFVEMIVGTAVFPGLNDVYDQLNRIWMILGTPNELSWPGVSQLPHFNPLKMTQHHPKRWSQCFPKLARISYAEPLVICMVQLMPSRRISASEAMKHPYFADLPSAIFDLPDDVSIFNLPTIKRHPESDEVLQIHLEKHQQQHQQQPQQQQQHQQQQQQQQSEPRHIIQQKQILQMHPQLIQQQQQQHQHQKSQQLQQLQQHQIQLQQQQQQIIQQQQQQPKQQPQQNMFSTMTSSSSSSSSQHWPSSQQTGSNKGFYPQIRTNPHHMSKGTSLSSNHVNKLVINEYSGPSAV